MALSSLKCNGTISFVYVKSGGRIMQISGRSDSLCIFLYEMDFREGKWLSKEEIGFSVAIYMLQKKLQKQYL